MKDIKHIKLIGESLQRERDSSLNELSKLNIYIERKIIALKKMIAYENEYSEQNGLKLSRSVPALNKNLAAFSTKIKKLIMHEESEVLKLEDMKKTMVEKLEKIDQKIKIMNQFETKIKNEELSIADKREQLVMDDLVSMKQSRSDHE